MNRNPFEYEEAKKLKENELVDLFIEDHNYSRMLLSTKNVFIRGERGSGKTMALLYSSFRIQSLKAKIEHKAVNLEKIGVYVPCNTPIEHKEEHLLLSEFKSNLFLEHLLVINIAYELCNTLELILNDHVTLDENQIQNLKDDLEYLLNIELPNKSESNVFSCLKKYLNRELINTQKNIISANDDVFYINSFSFTTLIIPIINLVKQIKELEHSHFFFMIDDAQLLKEGIVKTLNSWIAFRDHSSFSFKVATTKVDRPTLYTSFGGIMLEGHDFIELDVEFYYEDTGRYEKMARDIIEKRLNLINIQKSCDEFFPVNKVMKEELEKLREKTRAEFLKAKPDATQDEISIHVSRYYRVPYFRNRTTKSNIPPYSGFETIAHLSTGVIRNLLEPIYWMYDDMLSRNPGKTITYITPEVQTAVIKKKSSLLWNNLTSGLEKIIEKCSSEDSKRISNLFEKLGKLFKYRLLNHKTEPRALMFTITGYEGEYKEKLEPLFNIARQARLLYVRMGNAKLESKQEAYYVPNKMLWPIKGLDPIGQVSRVSLKAMDIYNAAYRNIDFPQVESEDTQQLKIFTDAESKL